MVSSIEPRNINRAFDIRCTADVRLGCGLRSTSTRVRLSATAGMEIYT